jgi:acylphosphatase
MPAQRLIISGRVQGVGYRYWLRQQAERLGLRGWVRNRRDGTVEALIIGELPHLQELQDICRMGPRMAQVQQIIAAIAGDDGSPDFTEKPTV